MKEWVYKNERMNEGRKKNMEWKLMEKESWKGIEEKDNEGKKGR